ncbi:acyl-CoA desaturase [uncultured Cytophaga sp.]|uniref:fatty acid desaturase family protein n=1 Tax=uncultured Cytophaga sp. TaxID=160238 RepID=UPI00262C40FA|nr:acyl-CoA desaturase [uncultured Cytophaga sp.]
MKIVFKKDTKDFHKDVNSAVNEYFELSGNTKKANAYMYFKTFFFLSVLIISYLTILFGGLSLWLTYMAWIFLGLSSVFLAVNCGHDAIHGAYSDRKIINKLMSRSYDLLGANSYMWSITHNVVHHTYTNIEGADEDIESIPFTRLTPHKKWKPLYRYQSIYIFLLYSFSTLFWVFTKDYKKFFQKNIGNYDNKKHPIIQYVNLFLFKGIYYCLFLIVPFLVVQMPWYLILGGFILSHLFEGLAIATIFALAHIVEKTTFLIPNAQGMMEHNWAVHQLYTTADFGRKSNVTGFFTGGLNFQIEHHLFPSICHVHYPAISEIVKRKATEYAIPYHEYDSFFDALKSHIDLLKKMGVKPME